MIVCRAGAQLPKIYLSIAMAHPSSSFDAVVIPHTNIALPWHSFDDKDYEFISTYRRRFKTPAEVNGGGVSLKRIRRIRAAGPVRDARIRADVHVQLL